MLVAAATVVTTTSLSRAMARAWRIRRAVRGHNATALARQGGQTASHVWPPRNTLESHRRMRTVRRQIWTQHLNRMPVFQRPPGCMRPVLTHGRAMLCA